MPIFARKPSRQRRPACCAKQRGALLRGSVRAGAAKSNLPARYRGNHGNGYCHRIRAALRRSIEQPCLSSHENRQDSAAPRAAQSNAGLCFAAVCAQGQQNQICPRDTALACRHCDFPVSTHVLVLLCSTRRASSSTQRELGLLYIDYVNCYTVSNVSHFYRQH